MGDSVRQRLHRLEEAGGVKFVVGTALSRVSPCPAVAQYPKALALDCLLA
jgi:hypothetical protein